MAAYLIADVEVIDAGAYEEYRKQVPAIIAAPAGRYLARGGAVEVLEGTWRPGLSKASPRRRDSHDQEQGP